MMQIKIYFLICIIFFKRNKNYLKQKLHNLYKNGNAKKEIKRNCAFKNIQFFRT